MKTINHDEVLKANLIAGKVKMDDLIQKAAIRNQDLKMHNSETSSHTEPLKNDRPNDPNERVSLKTNENPSVNMRGIYVLRPRLSWTGLYGKEPWPRERKEWEKV